MAGAEGDKPVNYLIGIDLGTSGTKTVLFDQNGAAIASATVEYPLYQPKNGWAEQEPSDWWQATAVTLRMYAHANEESIRRAGQTVRDALKAQQG